MSDRSNARPVTAAGTFLGIGFGGLFDGILFHQILQVHNMLSAQIPKTTIPNIEINMFWDGMFHAVVWLALVAGVFMLWNAVRRPDVILATRAFVGSLLFGWGLFQRRRGDRRPPPARLAPRAGERGGSSSRGSCISCLGRDHARDRLVDDEAGQLRSRRLRQPRLALIQRRRDRPASRTSSRPARIPASVGRIARAGRCPWPQKTVPSALRANVPVQRA